MKQQNEKQLPPQHQEEENTKLDSLKLKKIEEWVNNTPLQLLSVTEPEYIKVINNYLPYSIGIELECDQKKSFDSKIFRDIPYIMAVSCDSSEQRFRIPNGLRGILCLYLISLNLKNYCLFNPDSGIHYHVDMTDCFKYVNTRKVEENSNWILNELDSWEYKGTYNSRECHIDSRCWVQFQTQFKTAEIRIGEMTFDYSLLIKRILSATNIIRTFKEILYQDNNKEQKEIEYKEINKDLIYEGFRKAIEVSRKEELEAKLRKINEELAPTKTIKEKINIKDRIVDI